MMFPICAFILTAVVKKALIPFTRLNWFKSLFNKLIKTIQKFLKP